MSTELILAAWLALCPIESGWNPQAYNADVNRILDAPVFAHEDAWSVEASAYIFTVYLTHWGRHFRQQAGREPTVDDLVGIWQHGPSYTERVAA